MGCDFHWSGSIPDSNTQAQAVELYRDLFDPARFWTEIRPEPETTAHADFGRFAGLAPDTVVANPDRSVPDYPFDFYGTAPYLDPGLGVKLVHRGQLVFDRSDGGRIVSIVDSATTPGPFPPDRNGRSVVVCPGGYLRLIGDPQSHALALFLEVLRIRLCPDLEILDDRGYLARIQRWLHSSGQRAHVESEEIDPDVLMSRMLWDLRPAALPDDEPDEDPQLDRMMRFDFLPSNREKSSLFGLPRDAANRRRLALETLAAICRQAPRPLDPEAEPVFLLASLCGAVNHAWRTEVKPTVTFIQYSEDGAALEIALGDGRGVTKVAIPPDDVRGMLRRLFAS